MRTMNAKAMVFFTTVVATMFGLFGTELLSNLVDGQLL
jgi:hypothetical protein